MLAAVLHGTRLSCDTHLQHFSVFHVSCFQSVLYWTQNCMYRMILSLMYAFMTGILYVFGTKQAFSINKQKLIFVIPMFATVYRSQLITYVHSPLQSQFSTSSSYCVLADRGFGSCENSSTTRPVTDTNKDCTCRCFVFEISNQI
jgi:hypothetical protein